MSLVFAVCIFHYAVVRYNSAAVHYGIQVGSLILEFVLVSALRLSTLQLVVRYARIVALWSLIRTFS